MSSVALALIGALTVKTDWFFVVQCAEYFQNLKRISSLNGLKDRAYEETNNKSNMVSQ